MTKNEILAQIRREKAMLRMIDPIQPHKVDMSFDTIIGLIRQLTAQEGTSYEFTLNALMHTRGKEGKSIEFYYREANRPGAAKKRQQELQDQFTKLVDRIDRETFSLFHP